MRFIKYVNRRASYVVASIGFLMVFAAPALTPAFASAANVLSRSINLSSSAAGASNVTYEVVFTVSSAGAGAFVLDFCKDSPVPGQACTPPTGFSVASVATTTGGATVTPLTGNTGLLVTKTIAGSGTADVVLTGIHNPTNVTDGTVGNGFYGRIVTYANSGDAASYTHTDLTNSVDTGGVSMSITNAIGVTAAVPETMIFCVASAAITADCANASSNLPNVSLGVSSGSVTALSSSTLSTGNVFTQISTNAQTGAIVSLKSSATDCGGLLRAGSSSACDIHPAPGGGFSAGTADFGVKTGSSSSTAGVASATGTLEPVTGSGYNSGTYYMHFVSGNGTGVTSTYGDSFLDTNNAPVNNQNMQLTFGASISDNTPAGTYSADLGLIASGTY